MTRVCAIVSTYNEADVVHEVVARLIDHGVDVFLIDNNSTDGTLEAVAPLVGKGVINVESAIYRDVAGQEIFDLTGILKHKERIAKALPHDWFINADADEIRLAPWSDYSLSEGIARVDREGFNLINFKLFNFRPLIGSNSNPQAGYEAAFTHYEPGESVSLRQVRAWKRSDSIDIASSGGHSTVVPSPRVYPLRFLLKHYPIRSRQQAIEKVMLGRKARFKAEEKAQGWHSHYNAFTSAEGIQSEWSAAEVFHFDLEREIAALQAEANDILLGIIGNFPDFNLYSTDAELFDYCRSYLVQRGFSQEVASGFMDSLWKLAQTIYNGQPVQLSIDPTSAHYYQLFLGLMFRKYYLAGDPKMYMDRNKVDIRAI